MAEYPADNSFAVTPSGKDFTAERRIVSTVQEWMDRHWLGNISARAKRELCESIFAIVTADIRSCDSKVISLTGDLYDILEIIRHSRGNNVTARFVDRLTKYVGMMDEALKDCGCGARIHIPLSDSSTARVSAQATEQAATPKTETIPQPVVFSDRLSDTVLTITMEGGKVIVNITQKRLRDNAKA